MTMNPMQRDVLEFHETYGAVANTTPTVLDEATVELRIRLMNEELNGEGELAESLRAGDLVGIADGLGDLIYVTLGTAVACGINIQPVFDKIHASNMSKLGADGKPIYSDGTDGHPVGKVLKGPGYWEPTEQIILVLKEQGWTPDGAPVDAA